MQNCTSHGIKYLALKRKQDEKHDNISRWGSLRYASKSGNLHAGGRRAALPILGLPRCENEPKTVWVWSSMPDGNNCFLSENLSPRAQEQLRQMHSKVKGTDNAGKAREPSGQSLSFRHQRDLTTAKQLKQLEAI